MYFFYFLFPLSTLNVYTALHPTLAFRYIINSTSHISSIIIEETHNKMLSRANHNHHHFRFIFLPLQRLQINEEIEISPYEYITLKILAYWLIPTNPYRKKERNPLRNYSCVLHFNWKQK